MLPIKNLRVKMKMQVLLESFSKEGVQMISSPNIRTPIMPVGGSIKTPIMPMQNVIQHADLRPGKNIIQHAALWGEFATTPMQTNRQAIRTGEAAISERMYTARQPFTSSNFGTETKIGNGELSRASHETLETSVEAIASIMEKDDQYEGSNFGNYSALGPTGFQEYNDRSIESQRATMAQANEYQKNVS